MTGLEIVPNTAVRIMFEALKLAVRLEHSARPVTTCALAPPGKVPHEMLAVLPLVVWAICDTTEAPGQLVPLLVSDGRA